MTGRLAPAGRRCRGRAGDAGAVAVEWTLGVALLVLPVVMLVAVLPGWVERQSMARLAAREAARVAALAGEPPAGEAAGRTLALEIAANHGVGPGEVAVDVHVPVDAAGEPLRDGTVTATVDVAVPLVVVPGFGTAGGWRLSATHREPLDQYRSMDP